jgi:hypothetical protein
MVEDIKNLYEEMHNIYNLICGKMMEITDPLKSKTVSNEDMCDIGYFCREISTMLNELRKEVQARQELCGSLIAFNRTKDLVTDPGLSMKVSGKYASGTPDCKMQAALPKKFTPEYYDFCEALGVPGKVARQGVLRLDWNMVTEVCTDMLAQGKPVPPGLGKKYPKYVTTFRKKKE